MSFNFYFVLNLEWDYATAHSSQPGASTSVPATPLDPKPVAAVLSGGSLL